MPAAPVAPASESVLGRLPNQRFYMAMGVDFDGLGGYAGMMGLLSALDVDATVMPAWMSTIGPSMHGMEFAMYPSKLGVAMGGGREGAPSAVAAAVVKPVTRGGGAAW